MLRKIADNLDAGTSHLDEKGCHKVLNTINLMENDVKTEGRHIYSIQVKSHGNKKLNI